MLIRNKIVILSLVMNLLFLSAKLMAYDDNGNMTSKEWTKNGITLQMSWNSENRMTESTILNASTGGKSITRYKYDHEGNRVVKSGRYGEAVYVNQNYSVRNNTIVSKHIFAGGQRVVSKVCDSDANSIMDTGVFYVSTDHLGSTNVLTDDTGGFYEHIETFPDGGIWVKEGTNNYDLPFQFTNHTKDLETMFFYAKARYYDAQLGRFISVDPIIDEYLPTGDKKRDKNMPGFGGFYNPRNLNMYSYTFNNPVIYVDPDGKAGSRIVGFKPRFSWLPDWYVKYGPFGKIPIREPITPNKGDSFVDVFVRGFGVGVAVGASEGIAINLSFKIPKGAIKNILKSASRKVGKTTRSVQALTKKVQTASKNKCFQGLKTNQQTANKIIKDILSASKKTIKTGLNRNKQSYVDIFNNKTGQGIRLIKEKKGKKIFLIHL